MPRNSDILNQGDIRHMFKKLEKLIYERTSGRKLDGSSIGGEGLTVSDGGKLTINGGELNLLSEDGVVIAHWGPTTCGDGTSPGWQFSYPNGRPAFLMGGQAENPAIVVYDLAGNYVVSTDAASGQGLARPYISYKMVPTFEAETSGSGPGSMWPSTASTDYVRVMQGSNSIWHPKANYAVDTATTGGGTVDWRLTFEGTTVAEGSGTASGSFDVPDWETVPNLGGHADIALYIRCAGGATRAFAQVPRLYGRQS
jgi:hypothetical protein